MGRPEQILARPLSPSTDVFALGLMAASVLSAAIFGEEQTMIVPAAGNGRRRLKMIKHPEVWLDPQLVVLPAEARLAWRTLLATTMLQAAARRVERARAPRGGTSPTAASAPRSRRRSAALPAARRDLEEGTS